MDVAISKNKVPIRLTAERWQHISVGHPEIAGFYYEIFETIENPNSIYEGGTNELIAVSLKLENTNKYIIVVYKEISARDGFVITAYISNKQQQFKKRKLIWNQ